MTLVKTHDIDEVTAPHMEDPEVALYYLMDFFEEDRPDDQVEYAIKKVANAFGVQVSEDLSALASQIAELRTVPADELTLEMMANLMKSTGCIIDLDNAPKP